PAAAGPPCCRTPANEPESTDAPGSRHLTRSACGSRPGSGITGRSPCSLSPCSTRDRFAPGTPRVLNRSGGVGDTRPVMAAPGRRGETAARRREFTIIQARVRSGPGAAAPARPTFLPDCSAGQQAGAGSGAVLAEEQCWPKSSAGSRAGEADMVTGRVLIVG